jgi:undecaprenyl-diphosphatase
MHHSLEAILLGLIEGATEFIPVSSTGHLLIAEHFLTARPEWFTVFIQVGAALGLVPLFWKKLIGLLQPTARPAERDYLAKLTVAFLITAVGGLLLKKMHFTLPETVRPVALATLIGGFVIIAVEWWRKGSRGGTRITWEIAIACGLAQCLAAAFPGTSRSGATIIFAMVLGLARSEAAEFSFVLGMITLIAAGGYELLGAWRHGQLVGASVTDTAVAFAIAAISGFAVVRWLLGFVRTRSFVGFAIYRIVLGAVLLLVFA